MRQDLFLGLFVVLLGPAACTREAPQKPATPDLPAACCSQCAGAAQRDPAGMSLDGVDCKKYAGTWNDQPGVDEACVAHFEAHPTTVGECQGATR
jgi:hypothetical protein